MRFPNRLLLAAALFPGVNGCAFLLDFDELQDNAEPAADSGNTSGGGGGQGGSAGSGGSGGTCLVEDCDDGDPCTIDSCNAQAQCQNDTQFNRIVPDGNFPPIVADEIHQSTLVASSNKFFMSVFRRDGTELDTQIYGFEQSAASVGTLFQRLPHGAGTLVIGARLPLLGSGAHTTLLPQLGALVAAGGVTGLVVGLAS